jgi:hypothetical protein
MAINFKLTQFDNADPADPGASLAGGFLKERLSTITTIQGDLIKFALGEGFTAAQVRGALEDLFRTFVADWTLYLLVGADDIATSIQNDATLGWLDIDVSGTPIRQRLINRLS